MRQSSENPRSGSHKDNYNIDLSSPQSREKALGRFMLLRLSVMPRLSSVQSKPRLHKVAVTALFATLASTSSSSAFHSWATISTATTRGPFLSYRGGFFSSSATNQPLVPENPRGTVPTVSRTAMASSATETAEVLASATMTPAEKLESLRTRMKELNLDVYLVPSDDPHLSGT